MAETITLPVKDRTGAEVAQYEFDSADLAPGINKQLLHDVVVMYLANQRVGTSKSKSRGLVSGNRQKLYRQKGTGRARAGGKRSPTRRGGGHTFAKKPRDYGYRMPKKAVRLATRMALLSKFLDEQAVIIDEISCDAPKTKPMVELLKALGLYERDCLLTVAQHDPNVYVSARNIEHLLVSPAAELNAYALLRQRHLVITRDALDRLLGRSETTASAA